MINVALLAIAGIIILGIARYNKSNKLFWQLLMSFVIGFACGHCGSMAKHTNMIKKSTIITAPTHQSSSTSILVECLAPEETSITSVINYASQSYYYRDIALSTSKASAPLEENKGGPPETVNTS